MGRICLLYVSHRQARWAIAPPSLFRYPIHQGPLDSDAGWTSRSGPSFTFYIFSSLCSPYTTLVMVLRLWNGEFELFVSASSGCLYSCTALSRISGMSHLILDFVLFLSIWPSHEFLTILESESPWYYHCGCPATLTGRWGEANDGREAFLASDGYKLVRYQGSPPIYVAFLAYKCFPMPCQYLQDCSHQPRSLQRVLLRFTSALFLFV